MSANHYEVTPGQVASTVRRESSGSLGCQWTAGIRPLERFSHRSVEVIESPRGVCATLKFTVKQSVPCRSYSNSRRSSRPGFIGLVGCLRSRAWMPVFSSVLTREMPCWCISGAWAYKWHTFLTSLANVAGSSGFAFSQ